MAASQQGVTDADAAEVILKFWFEETKPYQWFRRDDAFDAAIRNRFAELHTLAIDGKLDHWADAPRTALARIILLDQFSRNIFRDDPRAFAHDHLALKAASDAVARDHDNSFDAKERAFFYMPFMHCEELASQERCVELIKERLPGSTNEPHAIEHRNIIRKFGRFPHRNEVLGRKSTPEEIEFLKSGGFNP